MNDICPITYAKARVQERGYQNYRLVFRDLQLQGKASKRINAYNELWIILNAETGIRVVSDYGIYDYGQTSYSENIHEHADRIEIINTTNQEKKIQWLQVLMK